MSNRIRFFSATLVFILVLKILSGSINAAVDLCTASVAPSSIVPNSSGPLNFNVSNQSDIESIIWVKITRPSANFTVSSANKSGWITIVTDSSATFTGGTVGPGSSADSFVVTVNTGAEAAAAAWTVEVSDLPAGLGAITCSGSTSVAISSTPTDQTPPNIDGDAVTVSVTSASATISWTTDEAATSVVNYGLTDSYGQSVSGASATSHSVTISSLSANTTYHFSIKVTDAAGNSNSTEDLIFTTSAASSTTTTTTTTAATTTTTTTKKTDTEPPKVVLNTNFSKPFKESPLISGIATDDVSVDKVEYSIDGGKNYLDVKITKGASVKFSFVPPDLEDGNYDLVVRATDSSGKTDSKSFLLIIDKLPPAIGGNNIFLGPQNVFPGLDGTITAALGTNATIAVNAVGGPTKVDFVVGGHTYGFNRIEGTNIWKGNINFDVEGIHDLKAVSEDGAGNITERVINKLNILPPGKITDLQGETLQNAKITVYVYSETGASWSVWDGSVFGQENPKLLPEGKYGFFVPPGRYYLEATAEGFRKATSEIFEVADVSVINSDIALGERPGVTIFGKRISIPSFLDIGESLTSFPVVPAAQQSGISKGPIIGTKIEGFSIETTDGGTITLDEIRDQKTILTFLLLNTWSPASQDQLAVLDRVSKEGDFEGLPIFLMESRATVASYLRRGGYTLRAGVDPEGKLLKTFPITSLPQHFFIDEEGVIREVVVGAKSQRELREILEGIQ